MRSVKLYYNAKTLCAGGPPDCWPVCQGSGGQNNRRQGPTKEYNPVNFRDPKTPMGTLVLLVVFVILIVALWVNVYMLMLSRGVTQ